jgi:hypothetical protein
MGWGRWKCPICSVWCLFCTYMLNVTWLYVPSKRH